MGMTDDVKFCDPLSGEMSDKATLAKYLSQAGGVISNVTQNVQDKAVDGANVFLRWLHEGTNDITGKRYSFAGVTFVRFQGGRVVEHRDYFDPKTLVQQFVMAKKAQKAAKAKLRARFQSGLENAVCLLSLIVAG